MSTLRVVYMDGRPDFIIEMTAREENLLYRAALRRLSPKTQGEIRTFGDPMGFIKASVEEIQAALAQVRAGLEPTFPPLPTG